MEVKRFVLILAFFALSATSLGQPSSRILGGEEAPLNDYPYVASLRLDNAHKCGGTIISSRHILTAAHCVLLGGTSKPVDVKRLSVRVGSSNQFAGGKLVDISQVYVHPDYVNLKNDLAILRLANELAFNEKINSINYAKEQSDVPLVSSDLTTAGWGEQANGAFAYKLQHTNLIVVSEEVCTDAYADNDDSVICLGHDAKHGSCHGDAGNGAVFETTLIGVSSFVVGACGSRYPDVYVNVAYFAEWINQILSA